ncbi:hypothetical protein ACFL6S_27165 [Candidatus Poribacteria bacterium]
MKRILTLTTLLILAFAFQTFPCFNPTDHFAAEVVLTRRDISYDLEQIRLADNVSFEEGAFAYRSHYDIRVGVILDEIDEEEPADILKGLSVKIQIPTERVIEDGVEDLTEAVDINKDEFDFKSAMKIELDWLAANKIVIGITEKDIAEIAELVEAGLAGWNARIIYDNGKWLPYNETDNPMLFRDADCGGFDLESLPENEQTIVLPGPSSVKPTRRLATQWGKVKTRI